MAVPASWHLEAMSRGPPPTVTKQSMAVSAGICGVMRVPPGQVREEKPGRQGTPGATVQRKERNQLYNVNHARRKHISHQ